MADQWPDSGMIGIDKMPAERKRILAAPDPIADRRQRALEAHANSWVEENGNSVWRESTALANAIEVATQVKITDDIEAAALSTVPEGEQFPAMYYQMIEAAFRAAGFEVVE